MKKRKYSQKQIKCIALQAALIAVNNTRNNPSCLPEYFLVDTSNFSKGYNYPYRAEVDRELLSIETSLRKRIAKLAC